MSKISKGLLNGMQKVLNDTNTKFTCDKCGFKVPKYSGNYSKSCPNCGESFKKKRPDAGDGYLSTPEVDASFKSDRGQNTNSE